MKLGLGFLRRSINSLRLRAAIGTVSLPFLLFCTSNTFGGTTSTAIGELSFTGESVRIWDCRRHQQIDISALAPAKAAALKRQVKNVSMDGQFPVLVDVSGEVTAEVGDYSLNHLLMIGPTIVSMVRGNCRIAPPLHG